MGSEPFFFFVMEHNSSNHILEQNKKVNKTPLQLSITYNIILDSWTLDSGLYFSVYKLFQWHGHPSAALLSLLICWGAVLMARDEIQEAVYKPQLLSSSFEEAWYSRDKEDIWAKVRIFTRFTSVLIYVSSLCILPWLCSSFPCLH